MSDWVFDLRLVQDGDPLELARVQRAMNSTHKNIEMWRRMQHLMNIPGRPLASVEERFVAFVSTFLTAPSGSSRPSTADVSGANGSWHPPPPQQPAPQCPPAPPRRTPVESVELCSDSPSGGPPVEKKWKEK